MLLRTLLPSSPALPKPNWCFLFGTWCSTLFNQLLSHWLFGFFATSNSTQDQAKNSNDIAYTVDLKRDFPPVQYLILKEVAMLRAFKRAQTDYFANKTGSKCLEPSVHHLHKLKSQLRNFQQEQNSLAMDFSEKLLHKWPGGKVTYILSRLFVAFPPTFFLWKWWQFSPLARTI